MSLDFNPHTILSRIRTEQLRNFRELHVHHEEAMRKRDRDGSLIFRGQRADRPLCTSLERACISADGDLSLARQRERGVIREFQRRYHHYALHLPEPSHQLEWLALMQHHSAPTRLLDWTYSVFVAAYFGLEYGLENDCDAAIWVMNLDWAWTEAARLLERDGRHEEAAYIKKRPKAYDDEPSFDKVYLTSRRTSFVCAENPFRLNERLTLQKGGFVCPGDVSRTFVENLASLNGYERDENLVRIIVPKAKIQEGLRWLFAMNITRATLFPGLDGFALHLKRESWFASTGAGL